MRLAQKALLAAVLNSCFVAAPPAVIFSTYLGMADCDDIDVGPNGDLYLACHSPTAVLPIEVKPARPQADEMDGFVVRLDGATGKLVYATRLAGSSYDAAIRVRVDRSGFANVVGMTKSPDFPVTPDALQTRFAGGDMDAFVARIGPQGEIVYSTFLGGSAADHGNAIDLDPDGRLCIAGTTWSTDFPAQLRKGGRGDGDVFIAVFDPKRRDSFRAFQFGGSGAEKPTGIACAGSGRLFVTGFSKSSDFPTHRPYQSALKGTSDLFLSAVSLRDLSFEFSTLFGGSGDDSGWGLALDRKGQPVVAGITTSDDIPMSGNAYQLKRAGGDDAFLAKFDASGQRLIGSTYFGGSSDDAAGYDGGSIKIAPGGDVWLAGMTSSSDLPVRQAHQAAYGGNTDGFVAQFSADLTALSYSSFQGGPGRDLLEGIALGRSAVFLAGLSASTDLQLSASGMPRRERPDAVKQFSAVVLGIARP